MSPRKIAVASVLALSFAGTPIAAAQSSDPLLEPFPMPTLSSTLLGEVPGTTDPQPVRGSTGAKVVDVRHVHDNLYEVDVYSPAMDSVVTNLLVLPSGDAPRPTLYLMQGSNGGQLGETWASETNYEVFFADKNVNVVTPLGGKGSFFTDWKQEDPTLGVYKWMTYYAHELPEVMATSFHANDKRAVAGMSMASTGVLGLAERYPGRYLAVGLFSGFPATSSVEGRLLTYGIFHEHGAGWQNAWGWPDDPAWLANDAAANVERLKGTPVYASVGNGWPGSLEALADPDMPGSVAGEIFAHQFMNSFVAKARATGVDVTYFEEPYGVHRWSFFEPQLYKAWNTTIGAALGA